MKDRGKWAKGLSVFMIAILFLLTACSGSGKKSDGSSDMRIMWWGPEARHAATLKAIELYSTQFPKVKFTPEYLAWDGYWNKLTTLSASKTLTDVLQMDGAYIQDYVKRKQLADLSDIDLNGIVDKKIIENLKIDGKLYGVPLSHNGSGFAYNKTDLEAAGIKLPFKDWTWDDFFSFAMEARSKLPDGKYPITDGSAVWDWYQFYQTSYGKGPMFKDGTKFNLDKDLWFKFNNMYDQFRKNKVVPPADVQAAFKENDPKDDPVASGKILTRGATVGSVSVLEQLVPGKIEVVNNPLGPSGGGWAQSTIFLSVAANSKNKEEAKKFIKWFITDKEAGKILGTTRGIPINEAIYKEIEPTMKSTDIIGKKLLDVALPKALPFYPAPPGWSDFVKVYSSEMEAVMFNKQTLQQAYDKIVAKGKETEDKLKKQ